jgi:hypothetical protein
MHADLDFWLLGGICRLTGGLVAGGDFLEAVVHTVCVANGCGGVSGQGAEDGVSAGRQGWVLSFRRLGGSRPRSNLTTELIHTHTHTLHTHTHIHSTPTHL